MAEYQCFLYDERENILNRVREGYSKDWIILMLIAGNGHLDIGLI